MANTVELLKQLGFGEYEAKAYMALLQRSPLNGYELAKASGIPRANIYSVLQKLQARSAIVQLDTKDGTRYAPISPRELTRQLSRQFQESLDEAEESLTKISVPAEAEYVWNIRGYSSIGEHARGLVEATKKRLIAAVWPEESQALAKSFAAAQKRRVAITTLCLAGCSEECGNCRGRIYRYQIAPDQRTRWLMLIGDDQVLAGELGPGEEALAVQTRQKLLVDLTSLYIRNSIAVAALLGDLGGRLDPLISPETRAVLQSVGPSGEEMGWLEHTRSLLLRPQFQLPKINERKPPKIGEP